MTFSLIARCRETGRFGVVVTSSSIAVASRCGRWARAGVGAVATQKNDFLKLATSIWID